MKSISTINIAVPKGPPIQLGRGQPLVIFCGPCAIESRDHALKMAEAISSCAKSLNLPLVYKSSFDKANRTSLGGFRGVGMIEGLEILAEVRREIGVPVITDVHSEDQAAAVGEVADVLQIPAFLCRQTDLLLAAAAVGKPVLVKKGQFIHPEDMQYAVDKLHKGGAGEVMLCERGAMFGYRELVVDFRGLDMMHGIGCPVVFDATHSVQVMSGASGKSSGNRKYVASLARAAVAVGVEGVFLECHDNPDAAPSDGPNMLQLESLPEVLGDLKTLAEINLRTRFA